MHRRQTGAQPSSFYRFPHSRVSRIAFLQLAGPPGWPGPQASPTFPHSSLPGYEEAEAGSLEPPWFGGIETGKGPVLQVGDSPPNQSPPGECNKADIPLRLPERFN